MNGILIRPILEADLSFLYSTWLRSFKFNSEFARAISNPLYYEYHQKVIDRILSRIPNILVAVDQMNPEVIFGYIVWEGPVIHFAYVKKQFRGMGIGTDLFRNVKGVQFVTHLTKDCKKFLEKHQDIKYCPYLT